MAMYGINLKSDNSTIQMEADFYEIREGFVRLYHDEDGASVEFAAYSADEVRHIVLQNEYTEAEVLEQMNNAT